jgi:transcriptional regulator with XRE-family HTH domain
VDSEVPFVTRVALAVRAGRHGRGMSQRAFAVAAGMSQSRVARLETGKSSAQVADLQMALAMVGLCIEIVDADGERWTLESALDFDQAGIVDRGRRRFPAHLPHETDSWIPYWRQFRDARARYRFRGPWTFRCPAEQRRRAALSRARREREAADGAQLYRGMAAEERRFDPPPPRG